MEVNENNNAQAPEQATPEANEQTPTPQVEEQQAGAGEGQGEGDGAEGATETPTWTPDYKYKVRDQELEFEDWAKPLITSEDTKKKFQELYTRGHGLEIAKKERDEYKDKFSQLEESLKYASSFLQKGDFRGFVQTLNLPKDQIVKYAIEELKYEQLPPEERQKIDAQRNEAQRLRNLEQQNQSLQTQYMQAEAQRVSRETDYFIQSPDVVQYAQGYDAMVGTPGAFRSLVLEIGNYHYMNGNQQFTVQQAVNEALERVKRSGVQAGASNPSQTGAGMMPGHTQQQVVQQQQQKPVIPNIQGQGTSPAKKVYSSIDQLRERHKEITGQR